MLMYLFYVKFNGSIYTEIEERNSIYVEVEVLLVEVDVDVDVVVLFEI